MSDIDFLHSLIGAYGELGRQVTAQSGAAGALAAVTAVAARSLPAVDAASITRRRSGSFETVGSTDDAATRADALQYELGSGPCVDAAEKERVFHSGDLANDPRWPRWGPAVAECVGVRSVLSIRLTLDEEEAMAGLNLYSYQRAAFDERAQDMAMLLATHAGVIVSGLLARERAANLEIALASREDIGLAMGVLMTRYKIKRQDAFDQRSNRKLRLIAIEVADTGTLNLR